MDFSSALRQLSEVQKPGRGVPGYARFVNRPAGRLLAAAAHRVGLSPNQVTAASALVTFTAIAAIALCRPSHALGQWVCLALLLGFALDSADGQLARLHRSASVAGEWVDHVVDCAKLLGVHAAVLVSFHRFFDLPAPVWLLAPLVFQFAAVVLFFAGILVEQLMRRSAGARAAAADRPSVLRGMALLPVDYGLLCLLFLFVGNQELFLALYVTLLAAHVVMLPAFLAKWFRELS
ncbi:MULTISPECIES: CDP-alcohol phosphatidyltransferase family protein [unclassified Streptomyces]|uniref:CDP-alcohol phosphatidyltransferase family protein n=1 Tax=unclassified Streptomyces TaxID=2593676 RepID=UPI0009398DD4|nr:CDP-alcohol phosphatidyltransferase family protein [Streptomyces sp. TSRI0107]OKJ87959.1 CDP-alcohol phosphatidyltransferase [Streptomyces sp. TSRI0107]